MELGPAHVAAEPKGVTGLVGGPGSYILAFWSQDRQISQFSDFRAKKSRYKDGTTKACAFRFLAVPYRALQCDRCLVITTFWNLFAPFHGLNSVRYVGGVRRKIVRHKFLAKHSVTACARRPFLDVLAGTSRRHGSPSRPACRSKTVLEAAQAGSGPTPS
jgi:hypothetical protein